MSRETIFSDCVAIFKQRSFDFKKPLKISFDGEPDIDGGGLRREFFTIVIHSMLSPSATPRLFEGRNGHFLPMHNTDALRANLFKVAGRMVASSIMQGGPGFPVFPLSVYSYFQNPTPDDLTEYLSQEDVVDLDHVIALTKVCIAIIVQALYCSFCYLLTLKSLQYLDEGFNWIRPLCAFKVNYKIQCQ